MNKANLLNGKINTFTGTGKPGYSGDGSMANEALMNGPAGIAIDCNDDVYVVEILNNIVRKINTKTNIVSTIVGCGDKGFYGDGGPANKAKLNGPEGMFVDSYGNIYIADTWNQRIRRVDAYTNTINTIAGNGEAGFSGDGGNACDANLNRPSGVVVDTFGNVYFNNYNNERIRKIDKNGIISTFAGTGECGYSGDGGLASKAKINDVYGLAIDKENLYFVDSLNFAVRKINIHSEIITTVCGKGEPREIVEFENIENSYLGGIAHPKGTVGGEVPHGLDVSSEGYIFIADTGVNRIRVIDTVENQVYTIAGTGESGYDDDGISALQSKLNVHGVRVDSNGNIYFVDFHHHVVRKIMF